LAVLICCAEGWHAEPWQEVLQYDQDGVLSDVDARCSVSGQAAAGVHCSSLVHC